MVPSLHLEPHERQSGSLNPTSLAEAAKLFLLPIDTCSHDRDG